MDYLNKELKYKIVAKVSTRINNIMECVTIEIDMEKTKNEMVDMYDKRNNKKMIFVWGDFNIDFLKSKEHNMNKDCIDILFSISLLPTV